MRRTYPSRQMEINGLPGRVPSVKGEGSEEERMPLAFQRDAFCEKHRVSEGWSSGK